MLTLPLLRSVLRVDPADPETTLRSNLTTLRAEVDPEGIDREILRWVSSVSDRAGKVPDLTVAVGHFTDRRDHQHPDGPAALARLTEIERATLPLLSEVEFRVVLDQYREAVMTDVTTRVLIESATILRQGVVRRQLVPDPHTGQASWQNVTIRGVEPALEHLNSGIRGLNVRLRRAAKQGDFAMDMDAALTNYERAVRDPTINVGVLSGIEAIDNVHHGIKRGDLALVLGFVSHLKTTFCLNWFYKAAVYQQKHVALASLETPTDQIRDLLLALHSTHQKFGLDPRHIRITYEKIRGGTLSPMERKAFELVVADFRNPHGDYGRMLYKQPEDRMTVPDIFGWVETEQRSMSEYFELLVIDYLGLVDPEKGEASLGQFSSLNRAIRLSKVHAMDFGNGRGIGVLSPFQANRTGLKEAEAAGGRYNLRALSGANEAERSADIVYYTYLDDALRNAGEVSMGNLKARNSPMITTQWRCYADLATRLIDNLDLSDPTQSKVVGGI